MGSQGARPLIIGHRGAVGIMPENTLAAYTFALAQGVDGIELDVHLSRDGVPVVIHDAALRRTIGVDGFVHGMAFEELRNLDAAAVYRSAPGHAGLGHQVLPVLQDVLAWVPAPKLLCIELKTNQDGARYGGLEEIVVQAVRAAGVQERTILSSFDFAILARLREIAPDIRRHAIIAGGYFTQLAAGGDEQVAVDLTARYFDWVAVNKSYLTPSLAAALHDRGIRTHAWVINTVDEFTHFSSLGVAAVTTDRPDILCAGR
jgi:glycerophosphoryl diester phosphodiesterase